MLKEIGRVEAIFRYPVKSMRGERLDVAHLGWHGIEGDRRLALQRMEDRGGFPWLTASKLPALVLFTPQCCDNPSSDHQSSKGAQGNLPSHVRTPEGGVLPIFSDKLAEEIGRRHGAPVQMMHMNHGVFDDATVSVIATETVDEIGRLSGVSSDVRRFRPNVLVRLARPAPFQEDEWVDAALIFGEGGHAPVVAVTKLDERCSMVNLDPDSATPNPEVLKAVVRVRDNNAGVYGTVVSIGRLEAGQRIFLRRAN